MNLSLPTRRFLSIFSFLACFLFIFSCKKEKFNTNSSFQLNFNKDTVLFDTVFTTIGSTTEYLKVYNTSNETVKIESIRLRGGSASQFRINVDGDNGTTFSNIEIAGNDSLFIFVEVTVDPGNTNTPFVVEDFIDFTVNGNEQQVVLNAWGQDAYYHGGIGALTVLECDEVWNPDKPHIVYGIVAVDSACTLTINAGTTVYCHAKSGLYIYKGKLYVNGELGNEVLFRGDRLESFYIDQPGQWGIQIEGVVESGGAPTIASISRGGIWINQSPESRINYAIIRNAGMGLQVDSTGVDYNSGAFSTTVLNTKIENCSGIGLWGRGGSIQATNLLVSNCGQSCAYFSIGGKYKMDNCTFADYWGFGSRTGAACAIDNYYEDVNGNIQVRSLINTVFTNCIMYGNNALLNDFNELAIDLASPESQSLFFDYCLVDTDINVDQDTRFVNCINGIAPPFCNGSGFNFKLSNNASSVVGKPNGVGQDIRGVTNGDWKGCYDFFLGSSNDPCAD